MAPTAAEQGHEVRQRLRRAAVQLIAECGWRAVSTRLVAERAGVTAGLVHYHFASLPALLREAAVEVVRETVGGVDALLDASGDPARAVAAMLGALDGHSGQDEVSLVFLETYLAAARDPVLRADVAAILDGFRERVAAWLAEHGVGDPVASAAVLGAAVDGVLLHRGLDPRLTSTYVGPVLARMVEADDRGGGPGCG